MSDTFSVDITPYVDLTLFDRDAVSIVEAALTAALTKMPDWQPNEGNTEVVLIEAFATEVVELVYAANRAPRKLTEVLLRLFSLRPSRGLPSTANITFTVADLLGHVLPAGVRVRVDLGPARTPVDFLTDDTLTIAPGAATGTVSATATENGTRAQGVLSGTTVAVTDPLLFVESAALGTQPTGGVNPESPNDFLTRGVETLRRLVTTLVLPEHFSAYALATGSIGRAFAIDNYSPALHNEIQRLTITGTPTSGAVKLTIPGVTGGGPTADIAYNATATIVQTALEALAGVAPGDVNASGGPWPGTPIDIEFRRQFAAQNISTITTSSTLAGGSAPAIAVTTVQNGNTTVDGADGGYVTVAVLDVNGDDLTSSAKTVLQSEMDAQAQANLSVEVVDPTITTVNVTATVKVLPGYDPTTVRGYVELALGSYLNKRTWGWSSMVRRNDLIALIEGVQGVEYLTAGHPTTPAADVTLPGVAPLADAGTFTITPV